MSSNLTKILRHQVSVLQGNSNLKFFRISNSEDRDALESLLISDSSIQIYDSIFAQLKDLVKLRNPNAAYSDAQLSNLVEEKYGSKNLDEYGVWVYYPWSKKLVHLLDEVEFTQIRTIRNKYKITDEEQSILARKKIGIVGLSVGQSVCLALALERICGEIRIADFDHVELSNLNRIRTPLSNLGLSKTEIVTREILEIDPYIRVTRFDDGINQENINSFFDDGGKLDLVIEECDSLEIKVLTRLHARKRGVPVIMETSDRGMVDIERFDLVPDYPLLHGLIDEKIDSTFYRTLVTSEDKLPYLLPILGINAISTRLKASGIEVGSSITTWPQLASDVIAGSGVTAITCRQILLQQNVKSGRYYCDFDSIIHNEAIPVPEIDIKEEPLDRYLLDSYFSELNLTAGYSVPKNIVEQLISASNLASSPGNSQKWLWYYKDGNFLLFIDKLSTKSFADNFNFGTLVGFGCAIENFRLKANELSLEIELIISESSELNKPAAIIKILGKNKIAKQSSLINQIENRHCNRFNVPYVPLTNEEVRSISSLEIEDDVHFKLITDKNIISKIASLICKSDRIRLMNKYGHRDFFENEIRWSEQEASNKKDGLDITLFDLKMTDKAGLELAKSNESNYLLNKISGGLGFEKFSKDNLNGASALGVISVPSYSNLHLIFGGMFCERVWLKCTELNLGFQPYTSLQMVFSRLHRDDFGYVSEIERSEIETIKTEFHEQAQISKDLCSIFLFRLTKTNLKPRRSFRKPIENNLIFG